MNEKVLFSIEFFALGWGIFKCIKDKNPKMLYATIIFIGAILCSHPFNLPIEVSLGVWSGLAAWIVLREGWHRKGSPLRLAGFIIVAITVALILKAFLEMKAF
ncbi:MAG: hypothetical protein RLZZ453_789 [Chlamydiota bacterium]|jgi:hypothetical protein